MSRPLRIEYPGAYYHVTSRGNERKEIFWDEEDRSRFIALMTRAVEQFHLRLHCYVLMKNHYHLLVETPLGGLNRAIRYLNGVYTQTFNRRHQRVGHLFQGRYKAVIVERDAYLLELSRYVHLNPWRVAKSEDPLTYPWSSLGIYIGKRAAPPWLTVSEVSSQFGSRAGKGYLEFVLDGINKGFRTPWGQVRGQTLLGSERFVKGLMAERVEVREAQRGEVSGLREFSRTEGENILVKVERYFGLKREEIARRNQRYTVPRYVASYLLRQYGLLTLREIGELTGLHYSAVSNAIHSVRHHPSPAVRRALHELEAKFKNPQT